MSSSTWTPAALSSDAHSAAGRCWRFVEAQHHVSTMKLTDSIAEQKRLEELIEGTKPTIPEDCRHLAFLLATPFRYGAPYPRGSRFRRAGMTPGVFYASELARTAAAETAFSRLLFYSESPETPWPANPGEYTAFAAEYATARGIDLTRPPFAGDAVWLHPTDYDACQRLAEAARAAGVELIAYRSVRDPAGGLNVAILTGRAFARTDETDRQTWRIHLSETGARAVCEMPKVTLDFGCDAFARDPRIAGMAWKRPRKLRARSL